MIFIVQFNAVVAPSKNALDECAPFKSFNIRPKYKPIHSYYEDPLKAPPTCSYLMPIAAILFVVTSPFLIVCFVP